MAEETTLLTRGPAVAGFVATFFLASVTRAQSPYVTEMSPEPYVGTSVNAIELSPSLGDGATLPVALPFEFEFYGQRYDTVYVNANGIVSFVSPHPGNNFPADRNPSVASPDGYIAVLWDDWCASQRGCFGPVNAGSGVFVETDTTPGAGRVAIEWRQLRHFTDSAVPGNFNFKLELFEGPGAVIVMSYGSMTTGLDGNGLASHVATRIGVEAPNAAEGFWLAPCDSGACSALDVANLTDTKITLIADVGPDVLVSGVDVPQESYPGLSMPVRARLANQHRFALGPVRWSVMLASGANTSTIAARLLHESQSVLLPGFGSEEIDLDVELPDDLPASTYRVLVVADARHEVDEARENNNVALSDHPVRIGGRAPDFMIVSARSDKSRARAGEVVTVDLTVANIGNEPGRTRVDVVLSDNEIISSADPTVGTSLHLDLEPRSQAVLQRSFTVSSGRRSGMSHIGVLIDPLLEAVELDETNNLIRISPPLLIYSEQVVLLTDTLPAATQGREYHAALQAIGGDGDYRFILAQSWLPDGLTLSEAGIIQGVPERAGRFVIDVEVHSQDAVDEQRVELVVLEEHAPLTWITRQLPDGILGADYSTPLRVAGGRAPYRFRLETGTLPPLVELDPTGRLEGRFSDAGVTALSFVVTDEAGTEASQRLELQVLAPGNLTVMSSRMPPGQLDQVYEAQLRASGGIEPLSWRHLTPMPDGLVVHRSGALTGIPERAGGARFVVEVVDGLGRRDTNAITLVIEERTQFDVVPAALPPTTVGATYLEIMRARAGRPPIVWELVRGEGKLPAGIVLHPGDGVRSGQRVTDIVLEGVAEEPGLYPFTLRAIDSRGQTAEHAYAISVAALPEEPGGCRSTPQAPFVSLVVIILMGWHRRRLGVSS